MSSPKSSVTYFAGFDWAKHSHQVVLVNATGQIVAEFRFEHTEAGWQQWRRQAERFAPLAVAVETSQDIVVDQLLQTPNCSLYPLNPKAAQRYRERKAPSGAKSDHLDAWSFADALRLDGSTWKPLSRQDPLLEQLHLLCRDEVATVLTAGSHGSTFGGTPFVTSVALATLTTIIGEKLPERAGRLGRELMDALRAIAWPIVRDVRGRGLLVGIGLNRLAAPVVDACRDGGLLVLNAGEKVVRLAPPLIVESAQIQRAVAILKDALGKAAG